MRAFNPLALPVLIVACVCVLVSCKQHTIDPSALVKSGFSKIRESIEIDKLFGPAQHFITFSGSKMMWNSRAWFGGRYELNFQIEVVAGGAADASDTIEGVVGQPLFVLLELSDISLSSNGEVDTSFSHDWKFGDDDWKKIVAAKGDFSAIGIKTDNSRPLANFDVYVTTERKGRGDVRPSSR